MSITSEIHALEREIREYENNISELESAYENIKREQEIIENEVNARNRDYDMTATDEWRGKTEQEANEYQNEQSRVLNIGQEETKSLLSNIQTIIERLREKIRECEHRISRLEEMLRSDNDM